MKQVCVLYVQRFIDVLLTTTSGRERPLCDCPILASILDKWGSSRSKPFLLLIRPSNPRQINLDHWQCGTNVTKAIHSERLIIPIVQGTTEMSTETRIQGMFPYRVMQHGKILSPCSEVQVYKNTCIMVSFWI